MPNSLYHRIQRSFKIDLDHHKFGGNYSVGFGRSNWQYFPLICDSLTWTKVLVYSTFTDWMLSSN